MVQSVVSMVQYLWYSVYVYGTQVRLWPAIVSGLCRVSEWQRSATDYALLVIVHCLLYRV